MTSQKQPSGGTRLDSVLAAMVVGFVALAVVSIVLMLIAPGLGWEGPFVGMLMLINFIALPLAVICMVILVVRTLIRRSRESRGQ